MKIQIINKKKEKNSMNIEILFDNVKHFPTRLKKITEIIFKFGLFIIYLKVYKLLYT